MMQKCGSPPGPVPGTPNMEGPFKVFPIISVELIHPALLMRTLRTDFRSFMKVILRSNLGKLIFNESTFRSLIL